MGGDWEGERRGADAAWECGEEGQQDPAEIHSAVWHPQAEQQGPRRPCRRAEVYDAAMSTGTTVHAHTAAKAETKHRPSGPIGCPPVRASSTARLNSAMQMRTGNRVDTAALAAPPPPPI